MNTEKKCIVCSKGFQPTRSDAKYCSNACKQKAHTRRQQENQRPEETGSVFFMDEYLLLREHYGCDSETFNLIFFCFIRKNLIGIANEDRLIDFFNSIWTVHNYDELTGGKSYRDFQEYFLSGNCKVLPNKEI